MSRAVAVTVQVAVEVLPIKGVHPYADALPLRAVSSATLPMQERKRAALVPRDVIFPMSAIMGAKLSQKPTARVRITNRSVNRRIYHGRMLRQVAGGADV